MEALRGAKGAHQGVYPVRDLKGKGVKGVPVNGGEIRKRPRVWNQRDNDRPRHAISLRLGMLI